MVVAETGSPERSAHLYHPAQYKMMEPPVEESAHRPLHSAVTGTSVAEQEYDLAELRRKLEKRMEYALVTNVQTDSNRERRVEEEARIEESRGKGEANLRLGMCQSALRRFLSWTFFLLMISDNFCNF